MSTLEAAPPETLTAQSPVTLRLLQGALSSAPGG